MNIGDTVKLIKKDYPSVTISRIRFLEKEGLIKPKRSKGGTRSFSDKDINRIKKILDLQENQFFSLKPIKSNPQLLTSNSSIIFIALSFGAPVIEPPGNMAFIISVSDTVFLIVPHTFVTI